MRQIIETTILIRKTVDESWPMGLEKFFSHGEKLKNLLQHLESLDYQVDIWKTRVDRI